MRRGHRVLGCRLAQVRLVRTGEVLGGRDEFLQIRLHHRHERAINDSHHRQERQIRRKKRRGGGKQRPGARVDRRYVES